MTQIGFSVVRRVLFATPSFSLIIVHKKSNKSASRRLQVNPEKSTTELWFGSKAVLSVKGLLENPFKVPVHFLSNLRIIVGTPLKCGCFVSISFLSAKKS